MSTTTVEPAAEQTPAAPETGDENLGDAGKKALQTERDARKAAENSAKELKAQLDELKTNLAQVFGAKPDPAADGTALVQQLQEQVQRMQHEQAVLSLANAHKITDETDLTLLRSATDPEAMKTLAARLAPAEGDAGTSGTPKPDLTQGPKGEPVRAESLPGVPRLAQAFDDEMSKTRK